MKLFLRAVVLLLATLWVGALMFFPVVAQVAFTVLPDKHTAGSVVRVCLIDLHHEGLVAGASLVVLLIVGGLARAYSSAGLRAVIGPVALTLVMLGLTAFSQYAIIPPMEELRLGVGGDMAVVPKIDRRYVEFDRLHQASVRVEMGILLTGLGLMVLLAREPRAS